MLRLKLFALARKVACLILILIFKYILYINIRHATFRKRKAAFGVFQEWQKEGKIAPFY